MRNIIIAVVLLAFTSTVSASSVTEVGKIRRIVPAGSHFISIWLDGPKDTSLCSGGSRWTINVSSDPQHEEKYSLILAAAATGQTVMFTHLESEGCSNWNSNRVSGVDVRFDGSLD